MIKFYIDLFKKREESFNFDLIREIPCLVEDHINLALCKPIDDIEIKEAVFDLGSSKSSKPYGFSEILCRRYWDIVGLQLCDEIKILFSEWKMEPGWNDTHLVLTPKILNPERISQFRPIVAAILYTK
ncbi:unnamed protein product [Linum trigynum]|uniref:Uncharacterized protein n=1 Tax=Linum trigynum TaxID=586398 RepID=A0AAV2CAW0_9ROSI